MRLENGHVNSFAIREDKMLSIYTTENIVTSIFQDSDNKYDAWYDFITKLRPTMNVLLNEDTDYEDNDYNPVYMFEKDYDINVEPEFLDEVGENAYLSLVMSLAQMSSMTLMQFSCLILRKLKLRRFQRNMV